MLDAQFFIRDLFLLRVLDIQKVRISPPIKSQQVKDPIYQLVVVFIFIFMQINLFLSSYTY